MEYYPRGSLVEIADPTGAHSSRPAIVISDAARPYLEQRHTIALCSTKKHDSSLVIPFEHITEGRLRTATYTAPWALYSINNDTIQKRIGRVSDEFMADLGDAIRSMVAGE